LRRGFGLSRFASSWFGRIYSVLGSFRILLAVPTCRDPGLEENSSSLCSIVQFLSSVLGSFRIFHFGPTRSSSLCTIVQFLNSALGSFRIFSREWPACLVSVSFLQSSSVRRRVPIRRRRATRLSCYEIFCCQTLMAEGPPLRRKMGAFGEKADVS